MLDDVEFSDRNDELADAIKTLVGMQYLGDESQVAGICASSLPDCQEIQEVGEAK